MVGPLDDGGLAAGALGAAAGGAVLVDGLAELPAAGALGGGEVAPVAGLAWLPADAGPELAGVEGLVVGAEAGWPV